MTRTMLFADFGEGPCLLTKHCSPAALLPLYTQGARRWWLVECASAEDGRHFIRHNCQPCGCGGLCDSATGCPMAYNDNRRLLDSGTNEVAP